MKLLMSTLSTAHTRNTRKVVRVVSKRPNSLSIPEKGSKMLKSSTNEFCDNSNDSGLDLESQEIFNWSLNKNDNITDDFGLNLIGGETNDCSQQTNFEYSNDSMSLQNPMKDLKNSNSIINSGSSIEYPILRINNDTNIVTNSRNFQRMSNQIKKCNISTTLNSQLNNISKNGKVELKIVNQPEKQHRARYQTEGSRGAIKDRSGNGFPAVKLIGYTKPIVLQVFIGTDVGRVGPHMFYQACRITGKNSKICEEMKVGGTAIIMLTVNDVSENPIVCDYVGILKERNVDVEQRFPEQTMPRNKKKSTRCRMVFRTTITNDDGTSEKLQVCSEPIVCTQPPGVPEICIASLESSAVTGGCRLFIVGKNFLKDSQIVFQECDSNNKLLWEEHIVPNKEYFHQSHLICTVPSYHNPNITKPVNVQFFVLSSGKASEPHNFVYTPNGLDSLQKNGNCQSFPNLLWQSKVQTELGHGLSQKSELVAENKNVGESASNNDVIDFCQGLATSAINTDALKDQFLGLTRTGNGSLNDSHRLLLLKPRFVLLNGQIQVNKSFHDLVNMKSKNCLVTSNIGNSDLISGLVNLPTPSLDTIKQFVVAESSNIPLPAQSGQTVENYFSDLASNAANSSNGLLLNKSMQTASTVSSDAFMSETNSQSLFPILSDSELKSSRHGMHDSIMHETGKSIMLSNLMQNSTDTSISSNSEVTSASLLQSTLNENIMLIETQTPILELSNNNLLSNENFNSNSSNLLLSTTTTESPTSHDRLLLSGSPSSKMAVHDSKNIRDLLSVANNSGRNQFVSFDSTNSMLGLASDNGISSNSTLLAISNAGDSGLSIVKKENDVVLTHDFSRISDTDFINYINANCFSNLNSSP